jgi:cobalt-zinc-cadmium efflux system outer membrane protein
MLRRLAPLLALAVGCHAAPVGGPVEADLGVAALAPPGATVEVVPAADARPDPPPERLSLGVLWGLALSHNPSLREAAADVEAARGKLIQAGLYPNPRFRYNQDTIGSPIAPTGNYTIEVNQEIVTAGKRRLDQQVAGAETSAAGAALITRKFEVLTRVRRGYYDCLALRATLRYQSQTVATLERGVEATRSQVEKAGTRPRTDLIRLEALLAEAKINRARTEDALEGAWRQLAAEVGVAALPAVEDVGTLPEAAPELTADAVLARALATHSSLKQAHLEAERARLAVERAKAGRKPNVTVGAGYSIDNTDQTSGGVINVEAPLPLWDRQQGVIHESQAKLASAEAAVKTAENRLARDVAEAYARYRAAARQATQLGEEVLPKLRRALDLTLKAYQAGSAQVTFSDVLTAEQGLASARVTLADARRSLWQAVADLQGLMQMDVHEGW